MCRPQSSVSSPVLPITVSASPGRSGASPRRSLAAPVPPARATTRIAGLAATPAAGGAWRAGALGHTLATAGGFCAAGHAPDRGATSPAEEPETGPAAQHAGKIGLGNRDEAGADPDAVEALGTRIERVDALSLREAQGRFQESDGDVERRLGIIRVGDHDHRAVEHSRVPRALEEEGADEAVAVPGAPAGRDRRLGRGPRADEAE